MLTKVQNIELYLKGWPPGDTTKQTHLKKTSGEQAGQLTKAGPVYCFLSTTQGLHFMLVHLVFIILWGNINVINAHTL